MELVILSYCSHPSTELRVTFGELRVTFYELLRVMLSLSKHDFIIKAGLPNSLDKR